MSEIALKLIREAKETRAATRREPLSIKTN
jgi:hypothetical protein